MGPAGEDTLVELQALEQWVRTAREKQVDRDDAIRRRQVGVPGGNGRGGGCKSTMIKKWRSNIIPYKYRIIHTVLRVTVLYINVFIYTEYV